MPSFLNKVFGYKKGEDKEVARPSRDAPDSTGLLDGKYEAIPPMLSPPDVTFPEAQQTRDLDRDTGFSLFRHKTRAVWQKSTQKSSVAAPHLTLRLPGSKENTDSRALGTVFDADPVSQAILDDAVIAAKRLSPAEALALVRACAQTISERGLETLGIMHPHWFSASPDSQRKLISLFIRSLSPTTFSQSPSAATSAFENELHYTRSSHDVAALLRWGLRHLTLENGHFGKDSAEWAWYTSFSHSERDASYPPKAFSELLLPHLPASHIELLTVTLDLISSLAAHAETNGISGSKLSKFLGIWLLVATRAEDSDDWSRFYVRWERAGRILEHLFLAHLREESLALRLPTRLQELVQHYPYNKGSPSTDDLFPRPRFSTRQYDALCVRVETILTHDGRQPKRHPIQLLLEAFRLPVESTPGDEYIALWHALKSTVFEDVASSNPQFARIFVDETVQLLSLIPPSNNASSPTLLTSPISTRRRSSSISKVLESVLSKANANNGSTPVSPTSPTTPIITDWAQFSLSGFGDAPSTQPLAVLFSDEDIEVTVPRLVPSKSERQRGKSRSRRRHSEDCERPDQAPQPDPELSVIENRVGSVHVVHIDEAFIDFWSDAIVDPISSHWPTFILCGLKELPNTPLRWLVVEQTYTRQQPPRNYSPEGRRARSPRPSFRSDISGFRINSVFSSARKRFSVFSKSTSDLVPKKGRPIAGELGEVPVEEDDLNKDRRLDGKATISSGTTAVVADQVKANEISAVPIAVAVVSAASQSKDVSVAVEVPSIEPALRSGAGLSDRCEDHVADLLGTEDKQTSDPTSKPTAAEDGRIQVDPISQDVVQAKLVARPADGGVHLPVVPSGIANDSRAVAETVAMPESTIPEVANPIPPTDVAILEESPGTITEPRVDKQPSRESSTSVAAGAVRYEDAADDRVGTEVRAQLQDAAPFVGDQDIAETEIHTPVRDGAVVVEVTPVPEVDIYAQGQQILEDDTVRVPAPASEPAVEEASPVALVSSGIVEGAQDVPVQAEQAADQESKFTSEQATIVDTVQGPQVGASAARVLIEDEPRGLDPEIGVPTPVVETGRWVDETPGPQTATEEHAPVQLPTPKSETAGLADEVAEPLVEQGHVSVSEIPRVVDEEPAERLVQETITPRSEVQEPADEVTGPLAEEVHILASETPRIVDEEPTEPLVEETVAPTSETQEAVVEVVDEVTEPLAEEVHVLASETPRIVDKELTELLVEETVVPTSETREPVDEVVDELAEPLTEEVRVPTSETPEIVAEVPAEPLVEETIAPTSETQGPVDEVVDELTEPVVEDATVPIFETQGPVDEPVEKATEPLAELAHTSIEASPSSLPEGAVTLAAAHKIVGIVQDSEAPRAAERLPLQEDDDNVTEIADHPVDVGAEPTVEASVRDPVVDGSVEDGSGGEPETAGDESEIVEIGLPVSVVTEALSTAVGVPEEVVEETDKTDVIVEDVDVAAEQLVTSTTPEQVAPFEESA